MQEKDQDPETISAFDRRAKTLFLIGFAFTIILVLGFLANNADAASIYSLDAGNNKWQGRANTTTTFELTPSNDQNPVDIFDNNLATFGTFDCETSCSQAGGRDADIYINASASSARIVNSYNLSVNVSGPSLLQVYVNFSVLENGVYVLKHSNFIPVGSSAAGTAFNVTEFGFSPVLSNASRLSLHYIFSSDTNSDNQKVNIRELSLNIAPPSNIHSQYLAKLGNVTSFYQLDKVVNKTIIPSEVFSIRLGQFNVDPGESFFLMVPRIHFFNVSGYDSSVIGRPTDLSDENSFCQSVTVQRTDKSAFSTFNGTSLQAFDEYQLTSSQGGLCSLRWFFAPGTGGFNNLPTNLSQVWIGALNATNLAQLEINRYGDTLALTGGSLGVNTPFVYVTPDFVIITCNADPCHAGNPFGDTTGGNTGLSYAMTTRVETPWLASEVADHDIAFLEETNFEPTPGFTLDGSNMRLKMHNFTLNRAATTGLVHPIAFNPVWNFTFTVNPSNNDSLVGRNIYFSFVDYGGPTCGATVNSGRRLNVTVNNFVAQEVRNFSLDNPYDHAAFWPTASTNVPCGSSKGVFRVYYIDRLDDYNSTTLSYLVRIQYSAVSTSNGIDNELMFSLPVSSWFGTVKKYVDVDFMTYTFLPSSPGAVAATGTGTQNVSGNYALFYSLNASTSQLLPSQAGSLTYNWTVRNFTNSFQVIPNATVIEQANIGNVCTTGQGGQCDIVVSNKLPRTFGVSAAGYTSTSVTVTPTETDSIRFVTVYLAPVGAGGAGNTTGNDSFNLPGTQAIIFHGNFSAVVPNPLFINITRQLNEELFGQVFLINPTTGTFTILADESFIWRTSMSETILFRYPKFGPSNDGLINAYVVTIRNQTTIHNQTVLCITAGGNNALCNFTIGPQVIQDLKKSSDRDLSIILTQDQAQRFVDAQREAQIQQLGFLDWIFAFSFFFLDLRGFGVGPGLPNLIWLFMITIIIKVLASRNGEAQQ